MLGHNEGRRERERQRDCVSTYARVSAYASERESVRVQGRAREREWKTKGLINCNIFGKKKFSDSR